MRLRLLTALLVALTSHAHANDGYGLWLDYPALADTERREAYAKALPCISGESGSETLQLAIEELHRGLSGLLAREVPVEPPADCDSGAHVSAGDESRTGYAIKRIKTEGMTRLEIYGDSDIGAYYGVFEVLRQLQSGADLESMDILGAPRIEHRILNHWDNLDRSVERGYAGKSLWDWEALPHTLSQRYRDYARANASIGINGSVLTNVNADAKVLTAAYLEKVQAIANVFRPYGIRVYLTARFSAPMEIGGLETADPVEPSVRAWWAGKTAEIYRLIPDFGGYLVKANSEGQPGPQDYGRSHAEGANMLADAIAPHGGIVMWRAFVYSHEEPEDRIKQAYDEFKPLDGKFRDNVLVQVKNGPLDFQPREPIHPLFGAMPETPVMLELQITKEYLGQDTHLVYLGPLFEEVLDTDTFARGPGSTVARVTDGSLFQHGLNAIAGVSNVGMDRNWTGSHFNASNWYAFGRLAWDPGLSAAEIADEWIRATFNAAPHVVDTIRGIMLDSREAVVDYMMPLGLVHIFAEGHHYGPGPWVADLPRADWTSVYYHRADREGVGFDRTPSGSDAAGQYFSPLRERFADREQVPMEYLLYFHRVGWQEKLDSGRTLWEEMVSQYDRGVATVASMRSRWHGLQPHIDARRFNDVSHFLRIQQDEARWWRDAVLSYFMSINGLELPEGREAPAHNLDFYINLDCPPNRDKPLCPPIYEKRP